MCTIVQEPNTALRGKAKPVPLSDISSPAIKKIITSMKKALHQEPDGVAIAAPQIAEPYQLFIVAGFIFDLKKKNIGGTKSPDKIFFNPEIIKTSKETKWIEGEGCLSVRWIYGTAKRYRWVVIKAFDEQGKPFTLRATGLLAQIFQHEIDHLHGILFIDHARDIRHMTDDEISEYQKELVILQRKNSL